MIEFINCSIGVLNKRGIDVDFIDTNPHSYSFDFLGYNFLLLYDGNKISLQYQIAYNPYNKDEELEMMHYLNAINWEYDNIKALIDDKGILLVSKLYPQSIQGFDIYFIDLLRDIAKAIDDYLFFIEIK